MAIIRCLECGKEFSDKATSCPSCGCPARDFRQVGQVYINPDFSSQKKSQGMSIASMILGIISLFTWGIFLGFFLAAIGIILGIAALATDSGGKGMAVAGVVTSGISLFIFFLAIISLISL